MSVAIRLFDPGVEAAASSFDSRRGPEPVTGGDIIRLYLEDLDLRRQLDQVTEGHFENHKRALNPAPQRDGAARYCGFAEIVGDLPIKTLKQADLGAWLKRNPQWRKPDTRQNNLAAAIACFNWAAGEGYLKPSPYAMTERYREERETRRNATDEEAAAVWRAASPELRRLLWLVDRVGIRTKEARELLWSQIDWQQRVIRLDKHKGRRKAAKKKPRLIGLDGETLAALRHWHEQRREGQERVFLTPRRAAWTKGNLDLTFARLRKRLGLPPDLTPYCFRHRFCTIGRLLRISSRELADQMGHTDEKMTERGYTHIGDEAQHFAGIADRIAEARAAKKPKNDAPTPLFEGLE